MKVLVFSMTVGEGHNAIAKSVISELEKMNCQTKLAQVYGYNDKRVAKENKRYLWACKRVPKIYDLFWNMVRNRNPNKTSRPYFYSIKNCYDHFIKTIEDFKPDAILCTHFYASNVLTKLRNEGKIDKKILIITLLTDYCVHPYWEFSTGVDYVIEPTEDTTQALMKKNFTREQIVSIGLPCRSQFAKQVDKQQLRKELKIRDGFTIFSMAGGNGIGNTLKLIKNVLKYNPEVNVICINGRNQKTYNQIQAYIDKTGATNIYNFGFVTNLYDYMLASDLVICRGGAATISEALIAGKPMVIRENMILNEKFNVAMLTKQGCALQMKKLTDAGKLVSKIKNDKKLYQEMSKKSKELARPNASVDVARFIIEKTQNLQGK